MTPRQKRRLPLDTDLLSDSSVPFIHYAFTKVSFPVFRHILDYAPILPKIKQQARIKMNLHYKDRVCETCGEFLDFPVYRLRRYRNDNSRARHTACRRRARFHESSTRQRQERFCRIDVYLTDFIDSDFLEETLPIIGNYNAPCPILVRTREPLFMNSIVLRPRDQGISNIFFFPVYLRDKPYGVKDLGRMDILCLPELYPTHYSNASILQEIGWTMCKKKWESSNKWRRGDLARILDSLLCANRRFVYDRWECIEIETIIRGCKDEKMKKRMIGRLHLESVSATHPRWFKEMLLQSPGILDRVSEKAIERFVKKHFRWFLTVLCYHRPSVFKFVSVGYSDQKKIKASNE